MPYPNEHAAKQTDETEFKSHYRQRASDGISFIFGVLDGVSRLVSIRADREKWTPQSFKIWLERNNYRDEVEAATDNPAAMNQETPAADASTGVSLPEFIIRAVKAGIELYEAGQVSTEIHPRAIKEARETLSSREWSQDKLRRAAAYLSREAEDLEPGPLAARLCWGDDPREAERGQAWILSKAEELQAGRVKEPSSSPLFYHESEQREIVDFLILERQEVEGWPAGIIGLFGVAEDTEERQLFSVLAHSSTWTTDSFKAWLDEAGFSPVVTEADCTLARGDISLPRYVRSACRKGLEYHEKGFSGDGLRPETVRQATKAATEGEWSPEKILKASAWFARHESDLVDGSFDEDSPQPGGVAWLLWGSDPADDDKGRKWIEAEAEKLRGSGEYAEESDPSSPAPKYLEGLELSLSLEVEGAPVHVMRPGPLFDIQGGEQVFDLTPDDLRRIAETSQALIEAGHVIPISLEHGIERGTSPGSDRRPYGIATRIFYKEEDGGIYADKKWTRLGAEFVSASQLEDGSTALRISPRVRMSEAYHPTTGESLGKGYIDCVSLTTMPRQDSMSAVVMSREVVECDQISHKVIKSSTIETKEATPIAESENQPGLEAGIITEAPEMSETLSVLLARGSDEASELFSAAGLKEDDGIEQLIETIGKIKSTSETQAVELARLHKEEEERAAALKETEVDLELGRYEFATEGERVFFRAALLSGDEAQEKLARDALLSRTTPNPDEVIATAITAAKTRGAIAADWTLSDEMMTTARENPAIVASLLEAIPTGNVVEVNSAPGSDSAGIEVNAETNINKDDAANELSRIANKARQTGTATTFTEAYELARAERPDLALVVFGE